MLLGGDKAVWEGHSQKGVLNTAQCVLDDWVELHGKQEAISRQFYVDKFSGAKRNRLIKSLTECDRTGELPMGMAGFIKCDKYFEDVANSKAPRMIQYAKPAVNVELAQHMAPVEHTYLMGVGSGPSGTPDCSKGMNNHARAAAWDTKRNQFKNVVCLLGDFSKFDSHVHTHTLTLEHNFWEAASNIKRRHLDRQLINNVSGLGMRWRAVGTRMSGTYNTGGGNSVINIMIMRTISRLTGITIEMLCDGDDSLVFMEDVDVARFTQCCSEIIPKVFGMKWEFAVSYSQYDEEYCHASLSYSAEGQPICLVDPVRALARLAAVVNKDGGVVLGKQLIASLVGVYFTFPNHPVLSRVSHALLTHLGAVDAAGIVTKKMELPDNEFLREQFRVNATPYWDEKAGSYKLPASFLDISEDTRCDVARSFGCSVKEQIELERDFVRDFVLNPRIRFRDHKYCAVEEREELLLTNDHLSSTGL